MISRPGSIHTLVVSAMVASSLLWAAEEPIVLGDQQFHTQGSFIAYAAPWSTYGGANSELKSGKDFSNEIVVDPAAFPSNVTFTWHWPLTPPKDTGVYGYNAVSYGSYDGGIPEKRVEPRQVKDIQSLAQTFNFEMARPLGEFNVLTEFFLTKEKAGEEKLAEIGFFLHAAQAAISFAKDGTQLGPFTDASGREWQVSSQPAPAGPYYMFLSASDVLSGAVDFKAALDFLRKEGKLTGEEWFNGLAFGVEPIRGSGSLELRKLDVSYK